MSKQGEWQLASLSLRQAISVQLTDYINTPCQAFFQAYGTIPFSKKHLSQYVVYSIEQVQSYMLRFFGGVPVSSPPPVTVGDNLLLNPL